MASPAAWVRVPGTRDYRVRNAAGRWYYAQWCEASPGSGYYRTRLGGASGPCLAVGGLPSPTQLVRLTPPPIPSPPPAWLERYRVPRPPRSSVVLWSGGVLTMLACGMPLESVLGGALLALGLVIATLND